MIVNFNVLVQSRDTETDDDTFETVWSRAMSSEFAQLCEEDAVRLSSDEDETVNVLLEVSGREYVATVSRDGGDADTAPCTLEIYLGVVIDGAPEDVPGVLRKLGFVPEQDAPLTLGEPVTDEDIDADDVEE